MGTLKFIAEDNEFAASTGANVNSGSGTSTFDYPPNSTKELIITSKEGDDDPRLFEVGDTYDISYGGMGGGTTLEDAVVIRSDAVPGGGAIVFEGTDARGDLVQIVWSPGFDLEQWYWDNFEKGQSPGFYTTDQQPMYNYEYICFDAGTQIAIPGGTCPAGDLRPGQLVNTVDAGPQPILWVGSRRSAARGKAAPVLFAAHAIGNSAPLRLSQHHRVLVRSELAELLFAASEVLVPAKALANGRDVRIVPQREITYVHILLAQHHLLIAEGAACESLLWGSAADALLYDLPMPEKPSQTPARPILKYYEALALTADRHARSAAHHLPAAVI